MVVDDQVRRRAATDLAAASVRCQDLDAWHRSVAEATDLSLVRRDRDGHARTEVRSVLVKAGLWYLRAFMDGPSRAEPGANARPGLERMARELGISRRQALAVLRAGVAHGYLVQTARGHTESTATYAAALPVDSVRGDAPSELERMRHDAPTYEERVREAPKRLRHDAQEGASKRTPPPHDLLKTSEPPLASAVVDQALEELVDREEGEAAGPIHHRPSWRGTVRKRLAEEYRADLERLAYEHRPADGRELLELRDGLEAEARRIVHLEEAQALGRQRAYLHDDESEARADGGSTYGDDAEAVERFVAGWHAAQAEEVAV